ncbi:MAG TPA: hypothetical protein PK999_17785, partial [Nitrospira sp.]|nr:hypothetical protein [Nitrospira sp.]
PGAGNEAEHLPEIAPHHTGGNLKHGMNQAMHCKTLPAHDRRGARLLQTWRCSMPNGKRSHRHCGGSTRECLRRGVVVQPSAIVQVLDVLLARGLCWKDGARNTK